MPATCFGRRSLRCSPAERAEQALHFAESLARGTPNRGKMTVASDTVRELV